MLTTDRTARAGRWFARFDSGVQCTKVTAQRAYYEQRWVRGDGRPDRVDEKWTQLGDVTAWGDTKEEAEQICRAVRKAQSISRSAETMLSARIKTRMKVMFEEALAEEVAIIGPEVVAEMAELQEQTGVEVGGWCTGPRRASVRFDGYLSQKGEMI